MTTNPISRDAILGSWRLVRTFETIDGADNGKVPLGEGAYGILHYLPDDRVSVLIAYPGRKLHTGGRYDSSAEEFAQSAKSFTAYSGRYTIGTDQIVHHLDICLYENDNHTDYVRDAIVDGDRLVLKIPPVSTDKGELQWCLEWERMTSGQRLP